MTLPASYDAWRTDAPEDDLPFHPGPHRSAILIEESGFMLDVWGWYDGDGGLLCVQIGKIEIALENVTKALSLLGIKAPGWDEPLDGDKLAELTTEAIEADADARAEYWSDRDE